MLKTFIYTYMNYNLKFISPWSYFKTSNKFFLVRLRWKLKIHYKRSTHSLFRRGHFFFSLLPRAQIVEFFLFSLAPYDAQTLVFIPTYFLPQVIELNTLLHIFASKLKKTPHQVNISVRRLQVFEKDFIYLISLGLCDTFRVIHKWKHFTILKNVTGSKKSYYTIMTL